MLVAYELTIKIELLTDFEDLRQGEVGWQWWGVNTNRQDQQRRSTVDRCCR